jgi:hypothetical protein
MLTLSVICRLPALATMRRISRADTGLAMMPMHGELLEPGVDMRWLPKVAWVFNLQTTCQVDQIGVDEPAGHVDTGTQCGDGYRVAEEDATLWCRSDTSVASKNETVVAEWVVIRLAGA